ncbi:MAG TPA: hypothetical protein VFM22_07770 [Castellaniella sp.]|jgi:hypothetical protein|nr:hypothetical protein [Castellaniella sp.]
MPIQTLCRYGAILLFGALVSGCASSDAPTPTASRASSSCGWLFGNCGYEGAYEPGEKDYAEEEAARLNRAQLSRLRGR